jgi:hypothetical protein
MPAQGMVTTVAAEEGHIVAGLASIIAALGLIALGAGAAGDWGWLAVAGGVVAGAAIVAYAIAEHMGVDYAVFARLESLEGKPAPAEPAATANTDS